MPSNPLQEFTSRSNYMRLKEIQSLLFPALMSSMRRSREGYGVCNDISYRIH
jgi:hypothetical protein